MIAPAALIAPLTMVSRVSPGRVSTWTALASAAGGGDGAGSGGEAVPGWRMEEAMARELAVVEAHFASAAENAW